MISSNISSLLLRYLVGQCGWVAFLHFEHDTFKVAPGMEKGDEEEIVFLECLSQEVTHLVFIQNLFAKLVAIPQPN